MKRLLVMCGLLLAAGSAFAGADGVDIKAMGDAINAALAAQGAEVRLAYAEVLSVADEAGQTVYFDNRAKQLGQHWVPADPRRGGYTDISVTVDQVDASDDLPIGATTAAIDRAMDTWQGVQCSTIPLTTLGPFQGIDWGYVEYLFGQGGVPGWIADVTHAGWVTWLGGNTLAVTYTFWWVDANGDPTDIDNNGKYDTALREIYYNDNYTWADDGTSHIDVETVALHEAGHGLSQGHFGKAFRTDANGMLHFAPRAVMNAGYSGIQREIGKTDNGGHCSIWGSWPNN